MPLKSQQSVLIPRRTPAPHAEVGGGGLYFAGPKTSLQFISSGCALLDCVLGGGWPLGRIANIVGDKSTGKTLLAIEACANFMRQYHNGQVVYIEAEAAFDMEYAKALGMPIQRVEFFDDIGTVEQLFEAVGAFLGVDLTQNKDKPEPKLRRTPGLVVIDSLDALSDEAEAVRDIRAGSMGAQKAKKMSELFRRLVRTLGQTHTCVLIISQVRDNIGVTFGEKFSRSGGRALDFYASQALWLAHIKTLRRKAMDKKDRAYAITVRAKCKKNKIALPYRECEFNIQFGYGIEDLDAGVEFLTSVGRASRAPPLRELKRLRGRELTEARARLNAAVTEAWYAVERNFVPTEGKYVNTE